MLQCCMWVQNVTKSVELVVDIPPFQSLPTAFAHDVIGEGPATQADFAGVRSAANIISLNHDSHRTAQKKGWVKLLKLA